MASYPAYGGQQAASTYPYPPGNSYNNSMASTLSFQAPKDDRQISRTPSPTPSEAEELAKPSLFHWRTYANWRFWIRKEWAWYYVILVIIMTATALISIYHDQIVEALKPATNWMHNLPFGWLIPIGILFVISFPPLFGHEIVAILCGLVWGLWIGFAIVCAGTLLGEIGNFYAFKYCCRARGEKMEKTNIMYACLAKVVRDGGFKIALIARFSAIPGHFTTAIFSTCGMGIFTFTIAAILSSPKQFITVYLGVILEQSKDGTDSTKNKIISDSVLAITMAVTIAAMWYLLRKMNQVKVDVIYDRRKARQGKLDRANFTPYGNPSAYESGSSVGFNPQVSETDIPLTATHGGSPYQQWDKDGRAIGPNPGDPRLYAPTPQRAIISNPGRVPTYRTDGGGGYNTAGQRYPRDEETGSVYPVNPAHPEGRSPVRQESGDSVGWDMQHGHDRSEYVLPHVTRVASPMSASSSAQSSSTQNPFTSAETVHERSYTPPTPRIPPPPPAPIPRAASPPAQYVSVHNPPLGSVDLASPPLPLPSYPAYASPSATPTQASHSHVPAPQSYYTHAAEPTDASYRTAVSSHSREVSEMDPPARLEYASSPPPPSYRTALPGR
ncbi:hypothetical protein PLICRDRAFT_146272 [Plicaturopsis crispa FD-325 SS-3]|uniref:Golgi apparatus membrane protein TVP38 n=1 Tax=Plicaturopsis crispa FD-325 SS-3 TaxID=944288 RepID=A0A0C9SY48_PLICR|nr:hypothetical protein PLICRDRAFT_146272 [Plicaturopsis crispa FD-325 SS-3]